MASVPAEIKNRWLNFISKPPAPRSPQNSEAQVSCQEIAGRLRTRAKAREYIGGHKKWRHNGAILLSTIANATPITFGQDPNDLTNASGRLPNDRPHLFRIMGKTDVPRTGVSISANMQYFSGKPWAATTLLSLGPRATAASSWNRAARAGYRRNSCSTCARLKRS
jgi:hypothetical protein